jgi:flagellar biosynthesis protein FlhG
MHNNEKNNCEVWAVGGGKGGVGKSFLISNIAHSLAMEGKKTILIDADYGGANLHSILGITKPARSLTDFFTKKRPLQDLVIDSGIPNLGLVVGMIRSFAPENINYAQKLKFLRHIRLLEADYVLADLGSGAGFNIIDTFLLADKKIVVILPEVTAMDNMYSFLKYAFFRRLVQEFTKNSLQYVILNAYRDYKETHSGNLHQFIQYLQSTDVVAEQIVQQVLSEYEVQIIVNQIKSQQDIVLGSSVKSVCLKYFGFNARYLGYIEHNDTIPQTINNRRPYLLANPTSRFTEEMQRISNNLLTNQQIRNHL